MKRDLELVRKMVLAMEDHPGGWAPEFEFEGYTDSQIGYHAYLLVDAGLANGSDVSSMGSDGPEALLTSLTWAGHEFANAARDEARWQRATGLVKEKAGTVTLEVMKELLVSITKGALGLT